MSINGQDPRSNVYLLDGTLLNDFTNGPAGSARGHRARRRIDSRIPRRGERLQRGIRPQFRRADQRADQVGHQQPARQRLRIPSQRRARRAQLLRSGRKARFHAQSVRRHRSAARSRTTSCFSSAATNRCANASAARSRRSCPTTTRARHPAESGRTWDHHHRADQSAQPRRISTNIPARTGRRSATGSRSHRFPFRQTTDQHYLQGRVDYNVARGPAVLRALHVRQGESVPADRLSAVSAHVPVEEPVLHR